MPSNVMGCRLADGRTAHIVYAAGRRIRPPRKCPSRSSELPTTQISFDWTNVRKAGERQAKGFPDAWRRRFLGKAAAF